MLFPPLVNAILPAFTVPAPIASVLIPEALPPDPVLGIVITPETFNVNPVLILKVLVCAFVVEKVTFAHEASEVTVTLSLPSITTLSSAPGKIPVPTADPPEVYDQVVLLFQLPVAME